MPKKDKNREMAERLARIEDGLARSDLNYAIRQLGDNLDVWKFDPSTPVNRLTLHQSAAAMDSASYSPNGFAKRLEGLYGQIQGAFEDYQKEKATEATIDKLAQQAPVDDTIERIFHYGKFSRIYRTQETRRLDEQFKQRLSDGGLQIVTSTLMHVFGDIANETGYFAGVRVNELRAYAEAPYLEDHVRNGFIALKICPEDKMNIAVPLTFT